MNAFPYSHKEPSPDVSHFLNLLELIVDEEENVPAILKFLEAKLGTLTIENYLKNTKINARIELLLSKLSHYRETMLMGCFILELANRTQYPLSFQQVQSLLNDSMHLNDYFNEDSCPLSRFLSLFLKNIDMSNAKWTDKLDLTLFFTFLDTFFYSNYIENDVKSILNISSTLLLRLNNRFLIEEYIIYLSLWVEKATKQSFQSRNQTLEQICYEQLALTMEKFQSNLSPTVLFKLWILIVNKSSSKEADSIALQSLYIHLNRFTFKLLSKEPVLIEALWKECRLSCRWTPGLTRAFLSYIEKLLISCIALTDSEQIWKVLTEFTCVMDNFLGISDLSKLPCKRNMVVSINNSSNPVPGALNTIFSSIEDFWKRVIQLKETPLNLQTLLTNSQLKGPLSCFLIGLSKENPPPFKNISAVDRLNSTTQLPPLSRPLTSLPSIAKHLPISKSNQHRLLTHQATKVHRLPPMTPQQKKK